MGYWILVATILVAGFLTGFSIGAFILPIGFALLLLGPVRHARRLFWSALGAVIGADLGYLLYVPLTCTATTRIPADATLTVCTSILGGTFESTVTSTPPTAAALSAAAVGAVIGAVIGFGLASVTGFGGRGPSPGLSTDRS